MTFSLTELFTVLFYFPLKLAPGASQIRLLLLSSLLRFYRAAWNADEVQRWEFCPSVRPSVSLSVKRVHCDKTKEKCVQIFIPCERPLTRQEEWLVEGDPFYPKFWVSRPSWSETADFEPIIARSTSAVIPSENSSINTNMKSPRRAFQWA